MKMQINNTKFYSAVAIILILAFSRLIPHPPNFTPILGLAVFAGATLDKRIFAFAIPLIAMLVSDIFIGFHASILTVYFAIALNVLIGIYLMKKFTYLRAIGSLISGVIIFYIITNFAVWLGSSLYSKDFAGLISCYIMALPFLQNTLISSLFYGLGSFFIFNLVNKHLIFRPKNY